MDVTNAVNAWLGGVPNYGFWWVEANGTVHNTSYVSSDDTSNPTLRPKLTLNVQEPCGVPITKTLSVTADTYLRSDKDNQNFNGTTFLNVAASPPGQASHRGQRRNTSSGRCQSRGRAWSFSDRRSDSVPGAAPAI